VSSATIRSDIVGPGYVQRLGRATEFLGVLGLGVVLTTLLAGLDTFGITPHPWPCSPKCEPRW